MSELALGVYKQAGQPDELIPLAVDQQGRLQTTATATVSSEVEIKNDAGNPVAVAFPSTPTVNVGTMPELEIKNDSGNPVAVSVTGTPTVEAIVQNITTKFREAFEEFAPQDPASPWTMTLAAGDIALADGNAVAASYMVLSKSPWNAGTQSVIETKARFEMPFEVALGLHMSQRTLGQEFSLELVDDATVAAYAEATITSMTHASALLTINTALPHGLVPGNRFQIRGCSDNRFNYPALVVASIPSPNQITATAGPGGTLGAITATATNGYISARPSMGYAANGTSMVLENATVTNAAFYIRSAEGDALPSGTLLGNHAATILSTASVQAVNAAYTYSFQPTDEYRLTQQADRIQWSNVAIDSAGQSSSVVNRTQVIPDPSKQYKLRIRANNAKDLSRPVGKVISAVKSGTTTATLTLDRDHGLAVGALVTVYGIRDQSAAAFPNLATATAITAVPASNQIQIVIGTGTANTSYGGFVAVVNGGNLPSALGAVPQTAQNATLSTLTDGTRQLVLTGSAAWAAPATTIGDYVEVVGVRDDVSGADLGVDGAWKIANVVTTALTLVPVQPTMTLPADFAITNCGGGLIKRTDLRLSFVRIFDFERERVEVLPRPAGDSANAIPVVPQGGSISALSTVTTVSSVTNAGTPTAPATPYFVNSAASTNGALVLTGTSGLAAFYATNNGAAVAYVKLYNKATAPTVGTDVPEMIIPVPAAVGGVPGIATLPMGFNGFRFALGLGIAITGGAADNDTTAVVAGQVKVKLSRTI
jgi:hypothetical protein